jgi:hypothetical protein
VRKALIIIAMALASVLASGCKSDMENSPPQQGPDASHPSQGAVASPPQQGAGGSARLARILVDGVMYYQTGLTIADIIVTEDEISGTITSRVPASEDPAEHGQISTDQTLNFPSHTPIVGSRYVKRDNGLLVCNGGGTWQWFVADGERPPPNYEPKITLHEATPTGISFFLENPSESTEFRYNLWYSLYAWENDSWKRLEPIAASFYYDADGAIYTIPPLSKSELITADWELIFGRLPAGKYMFKDEASSDNAKQHNIELEFIIG